MRTFRFTFLIFLFAKCVQMQGVHLTIPNLGNLNGTIGETAWTNQTFYKFMNVKFAESPSGPNRFKEPIPVQPWDGFRDSTEYGRTCPFIFNLPPYNSTNEDLEDCLHMAVFTRDLNASKAVMLYVHGGAFFAGSARDSPPEFLMEKDIVLVSTQYRLGPLGFLSTMSDEIPGNAALLDVLAALEFIQKYIQYFGGDPKKVTVFGQSAGAAIVSTLLYSPRVEKFLAAPVLVGGTPILNGPTEFLPYEWEDLEYIVPLHKNISVMTGVTAHDGTFLLQNAYDFFRNELAPMPNTAVDMINFILSYGGYTDPSGLVAGMQIASLFNTTEIRNGTLYAMVNGLGDLLSNLNFKSPNLILAHSCSRYNPNNTFLYTFDYVGEYTMGQSISPDYPFYGGVHHSDELLYLFALRTLNSNDTIMAQRMVEHWTSFAIDGVPNNNISWPPFTDSNSNAYMHLNWNLEIGDNFYEEFFVSTRKWNIKRNSELLVDSPYARHFLSKFDYMRRENQREILNRMKLEH